MKKQRVKDLYPYNIHSRVTREMTMASLAERMAAHPDIHVFSVVDNSGRLLGLISRKRLFQAVFSHYVAASSKVTELYALLTSKAASDLLIKQVFTCRETDSLDEVIRIMITHELNALPVVSENHGFQGLITVEQLLSRWLKFY